MTGNGLQFIDKKLNEFMTSLDIKHRAMHVEHLETYGQIEVANKVILIELNKLLGSTKGRWAEEILKVLWAYRCTPHFVT